jgi:hypothetical protein
MRGKANIAAAATSQNLRISISQAQYRIKALRIDLVRIASS